VSKPTQHTALLVFTRTSKNEAVHKTFVNTVSTKANERIAQKLIEHTLITAQKTGLPVFVCYDTHQKGDTFGERFANAFEDIFAKGYTNIIAIGNDCPFLTKELILEAQAQFAQKSCVIGPTKDGGTYLLGLTQKAYQREAFIGLAWETENLLNDLAQYQEKLGLQAAVLTKLYDIDNTKDFTTALSIIVKTNRSLFQELQKVLQKYAIRSITKCYKNPFQNPTSSQLTFTLRGPPTAI